MFRGLWLRLLRSSSVLVCCLRPGGVDLPLLQARTGIGPYLSVLGSVIAAYGASLRVTLSYQVRFHDLEDRYNPEDFDYGSREEDSERA